MTLIMFILGMVVYFLPTIIAHQRQHANLLPIFLTNLLFSWTAIGWLVALIWSTTSNTR